MKRRSVLLSLVLLGLAVNAGPGRAGEDDTDLESGGRIGQFKGYVETNLLLIDRLLDPAVPVNQQFELAYFFGDSHVSESGLSSLLGGYSGTGTTSDFRNGTPNGVNMLLWHLGFLSLGQTLGQVCTTDSPEIVPADIVIPHLVLSAPVFAAFGALCDAGQDLHALEQALAALWMAVHAYDLPEAELNAFVTYFSQDPGFLAATPAARVAAAVNGILLNPLFLLAR